jgi:hypothetical protein
MDHLFKYILIASLNFAFSFLSIIRLHGKLLKILLEFYRNVIVLKNSPDVQKINYVLINVHNSNNIFTYRIYSFWELCTEVDMWTLCYVSEKVMPVT